MHTRMAGVVIPIGRRGAKLFQPGINAVGFVHFANTLAQCIRPE